MFSYLYLRGGINREGKKLQHNTRCLRREEYSMLVKKILCKGSDICMSWVLQLKSSQCALMLCERKHPDCLNLKNMGGQYNVVRGTSWATRKRNEYVRTYLPTRLGLAGTHSLHIPTQGMAAL